MAVTPCFPIVQSSSDFERVVRDEVALGPGVGAVCSALGLREPRERFADGSRPVYAVGEGLVLKLYSPLQLDEQARECAVLQVLESRLSIPTPRLRARGELEGWGYVLMDRLRGENLARAWPRVDSADQERLATELGQALKVLHEIRDANLDPVRVDWPAFLQAQCTSSVQHQRARNLERRWLEQIPDFLDGMRPALLHAPAECLLHTEIMRDHLLVERRGSGWVLSGTFDFEPSMVGAPEYEFAAVGIFFSCGSRHLLRRVLLGYGYASEVLDGALEQRLLAYAILHKYSNLAWYLERLPPPPRLERLEALAAHWFGVGAHAERV